MITVTRLSDLKGRFEPTAVALGTFDGVHLGHQSVIRQAVDLARRTGGTSVVFTFSNHPLSVICPRRSPPQIVTPEYKAELIAELGTDVLLLIPFTTELLRCPPAEFVALLADNLKPSFVVAGPNFTFGYKGAGTPDYLRQAAKRFGFEAVIPPAYAVGGTLVSSTVIRQFILKGKVGHAASLLGRHFRMSGQVETGNRRGRTIGFPTANILPRPGFLVPHDGVYAVKVRLGPAVYNGLANIGRNPTFAGDSRRVEVHILEFQGDLYGRELIVDFLVKLRGEKTFDGADSLKGQIVKDIAAAHRCFGQ